MTWEWVVVIAIVALWTAAVATGKSENECSCKDSVFVKYFDFMSLRGRVEGLENKDRICSDNTYKLTERVKRLEEKWPGKK